MLKKEYRMQEREVKKVLRWKKPFFSYGLTALESDNRLGNPRFAIIIGGKSVSGSVERNVFRRLFYITVAPFLQKHHSQSKDIIFIVKKQNKLHRHSPESVESFQGDIQFLCSKIFQT